MDLDGDGYEDMLSGTYHPGAVYWWRGSKDGFMPVKEVPQEGYTTKTNSNLPKSDPKSFGYWVFTSAAFADYNGDGLHDLFVGGSQGSIRVALNVGTKENPKFGIRKPLKQYAWRGEAKDLEIHHSHKQMLVVKDINNDGVIDILMTNSYTEACNYPVTFMQGVKSKKTGEVQFNYPQSLLYSPENFGKVFPGCSINIHLTDYNNDGVEDMLLGISIPTVKGKAYETVMNNWIHNLGINMPGKDAGKGLEWAKSSLVKTKWNPNGMSKEEADKFTPEEAQLYLVKNNPQKRSYLLGKLEDYNAALLRHKGFVYVLYGKKAE